MRWPRLLVFVGIMFLLGAGPPPAKNSADESQSQVATSLLVQTAMQQARECLARHEYATAVRVLETQLPKINGHTVYLSLLEEAYRGYIKELKQKGQEELAQKYLARLAILDPGVMLSESVRQPSPTPKPAAEPARPAEPTPKSPSPSMTIRGHGDEENPFRKDTPVAQQQSRDALAAADREFQAKRYREAAAYYQRACQADPQLPQTSRERWGYCKLHWVTEQLNHPPSGGPDWTALEQEVRSALGLAPRLDFGHTLLKTIQERKTSAGTTKTRYPFQHLAQKYNGWQVAESESFRVFHNDAAAAEQALQVAERTRAAVFAKWLSDRRPEPWSGKCDIYLHATAEAYSRATGVGPDSPGHSSIGAEKQDASRVTSRRIDLHVDDGNLLGAVLPHEATHVTLAGHFGRCPLPRWADEGMAVLAEPHEKVQRHLRGLPQAYREGHVFSMRQLMELEEYPAGRMRASFYGQSVVLVQYLADLKGARVFAEFLRDTERKGVEGSLRRHYGLRDLADLDQRCRQHLLSEPRSGSTATAQGP